ncbi:MAG: YdhR family protein [Anaerolineales bacterium]|nr:YdhR family protein [Anaerolineales bacterium]
MMSQKILQINFKFHVSRAEYETAVAPVAEPIAAVPGLLWKVWLLNEADQEAGGIYLFADDKTLDAYLNSEIVAAIVSNPILSDFSVKQFAVMQDVSEVTRGPVGESVSLE